MAASNKVILLESPSRVSFCLPDAVCPGVKHMCLYRHLILMSHVCRGLYHLSSTRPWPELHKLLRWRSVQTQ